MSFTIKLGDEFLKVPKLEANGKDWPIWKSHLELSVVARGLMGYLDGTMPMLVSIADGQSPGWTPTTAEQKLIDAHPKKLADWMECDAVVKQIAVAILNMLFMKVMRKTTAKEYYDILKVEFEGRLLVISVEQRRKLGEMKLKENGDARNHIEKMLYMCEELATMGNPISDQDLFNIMFSSLPRSYNTILSAVSSNIKLHGKLYSPDQLASLIIDHYDVMLSQDGGKSKASKSDDAAFSAGDGSKHGKGKAKFKGKCHNCGKTGHMKTDCWAEGGNKEGQGPRKASKGKGKGDKANAAAEDSDQEPDRVWIVSVCDGDSGTMGDEVDDWLTEVDEDVLNPDVLEEEEAAFSSYDYATLASTSTSDENVELYDSGASQHMSPYHDQFINYQPITPKPITAADKRTFSAIGRGDLQIEVPNGSNQKRFLLKNVLYAPAMGVTLVSISKLTAAGYAALFRKKSCKIFDGKKKLMGEIPVSNGLYRVKGKSPKPFAGLAKENEMLTIIRKKGICHYSS